MLYRTIPSGLEAESSRSLCSCACGCLGFPNVFARAWPQSQKRFCLDGPVGAIDSWLTVASCCGARRSGHHFATDSRELWSWKVPTPTLLPSRGRGFERAERLTRVVVGSNGTSAGFKTKPWSYLVLTIARLS